MEAAIELRTLGGQGFHGFMIAKEIKEHEGARMLTAHGTLYKALGRMEDAGLLASEWEDPIIAADQGRPRRRMYSVTSAGEIALAKAQERRLSCPKGGLAPA